MINDATLAVFKQFERGKDPATGKLLQGPATEAYLDTLASPPVWTIGWGETGPHVIKGLKWTSKQCDDALIRRANAFASSVLDECEVEPNENQLGAMTLLAYNIGMGWRGKKRPTGARDGFRQSDVLKKHNQGDFVGAAECFGNWRKAGGEIRAGLVRRRAAEKNLYLTPPEDDTPQSINAPAESPKSIETKLKAATSVIGTAAVAAQQAVAQSEGLWNQVREWGVNPHYLLAALGVACVVSLCYFLFIKKDD